MSLDTDRRCFAEVILHGIERKGHVSGRSSKEHCRALALLLSQGQGGGTRDQFLPQT